MKIKHWKHKAIFVLFAVALASSLILTFVPLPVICSPNEGCFAVQSSSYAQTFGIRNDYFGDILFVFMMLITASYIVNPTKNKEFIIKSGIYLASLTAIYFIYLQIFVIHSFCKYCMVIDSGMILALIIINIPGKKKKEKEKIKISVEGD